MQYPTPTPPPSDDTGAESKTLSAVMENVDYYSIIKKTKPKKQLKTIQAAALFGRFKDICSLIKVAETVSATLLGAYGGKKTECTSSLNCVFLIPWSHLLGGGNKAAAFWPLLLRDSIHRPEHKKQAEAFSPGNQGPDASALYTAMDNVHYLCRGHKRGKGKDFIVGGWQVCLAVGRCLLHAGPVYSPAALPVAGIS